MKTRLIAGISAAILLVALIFLAPTVWIAPVVVIAAILCYREFDGMFFEKSNSVRVIILAVLLGGSVLALWKSMERGFLAFWLTFIFLCANHVIFEAKSGDMQKTARSLVLQLVGYWYVIALVGFLLPILEEAEGKKLIFLLFLIVFIGDSSAYFAGKFFGKRKLATALSPKKTIEGAMGSIAGSLIVAWLWVKYFGESFSDPQNQMILAFTPIVNALGQLGDLFESLLKRSQAYKDSGSFLPGHGGILDRIDGLAFSAPAFYYFLTEYWVRL